MEHSKQKEYDQLFVGGDLSGIQKFLYNIPSHKAAASLKGRSAFLTNYLREVCNKIESVIPLKDGNKNYDELYCSGGKFYLITQNTEAIVEAIDNCAKSIIENLWEEHKGQLGLNISHVAFKECNGEFTVQGHENEEKKNSGILWKYLNAEFARQKNQKFKNLLFDRYGEFFEVQKVGGHPKVCAVTGIESSDCVPFGDGQFILPSVKEQIEKGEDLNNGNLKTFEDYADGSSLGILRMDVDGLGKRFIVGFDTILGYKKFSANVKDFFEGCIGGSLEGYKDKKLLDVIVPNDKKKKAYRDYLNVIYAGGDDLFIIGRWDRLIDFAELIHKETEKKFANDDYGYIDETGRKCHISISGGIAIVKPKFPIAKAAEMAGEAEEASKQIEGKNAFNMFGKTIKWNGEFGRVKEYKNKFVSYIQDKDIEFNKSILHKLMLYSTLADMNKVKEQKNYSYVWHKAYYITRFMEKYKNSNKESDPIKREKKKERWDFCRELRDGPEKGNVNNERFLELIAVAARWAEQELKMSNN